MTQYEKSGPPPEPKETKVDQSQIIQDLQTRLSRQEQHIKDLDREIRRLKNDLRLAITAFNSDRG